MNATAGEPASDLSRPGSVSAEHQERLVGHLVGAGAQLGEGPHGDDDALERLRTEPDQRDQVEVQLSIRARHAAEYVHVRDPRGAGFEPETLHSQYKWDLGISWYEEVRDSGTNFFFEWLPAGEYTFRYRLRANMAGSFRVAPAVSQEAAAENAVLSAPIRRPASQKSVTERCRRLKCKPIPTSTPR